MNTLQNQYQPHSGPEWRSAIRKHKNYLELLPSNAAYPALRVNPEQEFLVWGIVIHHIRMNS